MLIAFRLARCLGIADQQAEMLRALDQRTVVFGGAQRVVDAQQAQAVGLAEQLLQIQ